MNSETMSASDCLPVAALQWQGHPQWTHNRRTIARLLAQAAQRGARLVLLPENFAAMPTDTCAERGQARTVLEQLQAWSAAFGIWLVAGGMPWRDVASERRARNRCWVLAPDGGIAARYDKIHLFDARIGERPYAESEHIEPGAEPVTIEIEGWRIGLSICYDLRFPELYRRYADAGCDLLLLSAAFTAATGEAHWEPLLRARAIENQCYLLAAAQWGRHADGRRTWGHSMVVDPWGRIMRCQAEASGVVDARLQRASLARIRAQLPALTHRRLS